jgi:hypothetical protein
MRWKWAVLCALCLLLPLALVAAAKPKIITFGRWQTVTWMGGDAQQSPQELRVRPLLVNGEVVEYTLGEPHEVTSGVFVVQRALRVNDRLPGEPAERPMWSWRPAGWMMVTRRSARISRLVLPEFDPFVSRVVWFQDFAAYCGVPDTGDRIYAVVTQIGRRKPVVRRLLGAAKGSALPNAECELPTWQRRPTRVTFQAKGGDTVSFEVRNFAVELAPESAEDPLEQE